MAVSEKRKKLLGKKARSIENSKKSVASTEYCKQIVTMKQALEEKSEAIQQMNDELLHKNLIIEQKDEKLRQKDLIIVDQKVRMNQKDSVISEKEIIISQQLEYIEELNDIIDFKEFVIFKKEDFIEDKIQLIKAQDRKIYELKSVTCTLDERIVQLEEANKHNKAKINANHREPGDFKAMYDRLKIYYHNSMMRCQDKERNILELDQYIECLHATLERNGIFEDIFWVDDSTDECTADAKENLSTEIIANPSHRSDPDISMKKIANELILLENNDPVYQFSDIFEHKPSRNISDMKPKGILAKKATNKKSFNPIQNVTFSKLVTVAYF